MTIHEIISEYVNARQIERTLAMKHSGEYEMQAHYAACDATSRWAVLMINHPDWTSELADKWYPSAIEDIAYPVSC
jgi:predicted RNA polymerase sigma factor